MHTVIEYSIFPLQFKAKMCSLFNALFKLEHQINCSLMFQKALSIYNVLLCIFIAYTQCEASME